MASAIKNVKDLAGILSDTKNKAAIEKILKEIDENIEDKNTKATNVRKLVVELVFNPGGERDASAYQVVIKKKLADYKSEPEIALVGKHQSLPIREKEPKKKSAKQSK
jgi:hypothetical protein